MSSEKEKQSSQLKSNLNAMNSSNDLHRTYKLKSIIESTPQHLPVRNSWVNEMTCSPMTPKQKMVDMLEIMENNSTKNFPSKAEFYKGRSSFTQNSHYVQPGSSPIVQYYVGGMGKAMLALIIPLFDKLKMMNYGERVINRLLMSYPQLVNCFAYPGMNMSMFNNNNSNVNMNYVMRKNY